MKQVGVGNCAICGLPRGTRFNVVLEGLKKNLGEQEVASRWKYPDNDHAHGGCIAAENKYLKEKSK